MRTTINVRDDIISDIIEYYDAKSKTEAVNKALEDFAMDLKRKKIIEIRGKIDIEDDLDELKKKEIQELKEL